MDAKEARAKFNDKVADAESKFGDDGSLVGKLLGGNGGELAGALSGLKGLTGAFKIFSEIKSVISMVVSKNPIGIIVKLLTGIVKVVGKISKAIDDGIDKYVNLQTTYLAKVNTRLDGLPKKKTYDSIAAGFAGVFGANRYVSQTSLIEKMGELVNAGIAYNLEQRSILSELSERMVSTFDMLDEHLTRLTKLQQADMSVAAIGAESYLTTFLNNTFQDTSYLSTVYDNVASALVDASSQMTAKDSVAFNYNVQKWLGSLYALGMSETGVMALAEGINELATGGFENLDSNDPLRVLFAMASNGAYSDLLVNGVNADNVNSLLNNIVTYLAQISTDTNQVTKRVKAGVFGDLSLSDIRSIANLTTTDVNAINNSNINWGQAIERTNTYLLNKVNENTTAAIQAQNLIQNLTYTLGQDLVENEKAYIAYVVGGQIGGALGDTIQGMAKISNFVGTVETLFNGIRTATDSFSDIMQRAKTGQTSSFWRNLLGLGNKTLYDESMWNLEPDSLIRQRGESYAGTAGVVQGISSSVYVQGYSNYSDTGLSSNFYNNAVSANETNLSYTGTSVAIRDINDLYSALFEEQKAIKVILSSVESQAQNDLTNKVYRVNENYFVDIVDDVSDGLRVVKNVVSKIFSPETVNTSEMNIRSVGL